MVELEDFHEDILAKAMRGLGIGKSEMASLLKIEKKQVEAVLGGALEEKVIAGMAEALGLSASKLIDSARKNWSPSPLKLERMKQFNLPFGGMRVNSYVIWDQQTSRAWVFDTGPEVATILEFLKKSGPETQ